MIQFAEKILKMRWYIMAGVLLITLFFGYHIGHISLDSDIINSLSKDDPSAVLYKQVGEEFGGNEMGMVIVETDNIFRTDVLHHIKQLTDSIQYTPGVSTVTSITNILDIKSTEEGIEIGKLVDEYDIPESQQALDSLRAYALSKEMYKGAIISEDATATIIVFTLFPDTDKQEVANEIKRMTSGINLPETLYYGGLSFMLNEITELMVSDMLWLLPITFLVIASVLLLSFKSLRGVFLPLLTAAISVTWTIGLMVVLGYKMTITSSYIPVILFAIGTAYTIHVLNSFNAKYKTDRRQAIIGALVYTVIPVILAAVTTMIGFISFIFGSYLQMITDFGIFSAIGTFTALLLSLFFIPSLLSVLPEGGLRKNKESKGENSWLARKVLLPLSKLMTKHPKYTISIWGVILIISISGIFFIKTSVNIADYFKADNPTRVTEDLMQKKFGGSFPVFVVFEGDMQSPEVLQLMLHTEQRMKEDPNITTTQSVADLVEQMNDAMGEGLAIPDEKAKIEQLWFLLDGQEVMSQMVSPELDKGIIQSKFASIKTTDIELFVKRMDEFIGDNQMDNCKISITGIPSIYSKLNSSLVKSQFSSLAIAIILVLVIVGLILRSFSKGVYAAIPIVVTILFLLGFMGIFGIPLDIATVLVGSIALGIGIDYSIHITSGVNSHLNGAASIEEAIEKTLMLSGKAVIINAMSVAMGFLVLVFAQIVPFQNFGLLVAISMLGSSIGALTLLPVILILANRVKQKYNSLK